VTRVYFDILLCRWNPSFPNFTLSSKTMWRSVAFISSFSILFLFSSDLVRFVTQMIKFYTRRQKYLELLEKRKIPEALNCLRNELSPIGLFPDLYHLSRLHLTHSSILLFYLVNCTQILHVNVYLFDLFMFSFSLLMCTSGEEVKRRAKWDGANSKSRSELLYKLHGTFHSNFHRVNNLQWYFVNICKLKMNDITLQSIFLHR
jgi:hypothetical protein